MIQMTEPFVHIDQLTIQYPPKMVLNDLSWTINKGENYVLGGKSGTGKTTLAKAIAGLIPSDGRVSIQFDPTVPFAPKLHYISDWYQVTDLDGDRDFHYQQRYNQRQGQDTLAVKAEPEHFAEQENLDFADIADKVVEIGFEN